MACSWLHSKSGLPGTAWKPWKAHPPDRYPVRPIAARTLLSLLQLHRTHKEEDTAEALR